MGDWGIMKDQAIYNTHPNVVEIIDSKDCFDKDGKPVTLDDTKVATELAKLQTAWNSKDYARKRRPLYGTWEEQLDMMYHGTWKDHVAKVKADIPKGNS